MAEIIKSDRYKQFEDKYAETFTNMLINNGIDLNKIRSTPEGLKALEEELNSYVVRQMKRETNDPTKTEFEQSTPIEQARIYSQKTRTPFNDSRELVAGFPRNTSSSLYNSGMAEKTFDLANDALSGMGRGLSSLFSGGDRLEEMGTIQGQGVGRSILKDPMLPIGFGLGGAFQTAKPLYGAIGRGLGGGAIQSTLRSGSEGRMPTIAEVGTDLAFGLGGEALGSLLGSASSSLLKSTGGFAGASGKGSQEALDYLKLRPQNPIGPNGLRSPITSNQKQVAKLVGTEAEIGEELIDKISRFEDFLPETKLIRPIIGNMPDLDVMPILEAIESAKVKGTMLTKEFKAINKEIDEAVSGLLEDLPSGGKVSALDLYDFRKMLDQSIDHGRMGVAPMSKSLESGYNKARTLIKQTLEKTADEIGSPEYKNLMNRLSNKLSVKDKVTRWVGKNKDVADERAEGVVSSLYGKNKTKKQEIMAEFDNITNGKTAEQARLANLGKQVGMEETGLPYFSDVSNGKGLWNLTGLASPKLQANVVYPVADALRVGLKDVGLGSRVAEQLKGRQQEVLQNSILNTEY